MIERASSANPRVRALLAQHPKVGTVEVGDNPGLDFSMSGWNRQIVIGTTHAILPELTDNNPLVCADQLVLPTPAATLAVLALGPLLSAGLLLETPAILTNVPCQEDEIGEALVNLHWDQGVALHVEPQDLKGGIALTAMALVPALEDFDELDELYRERYGRTFFVHEDDEVEDWDIQRVMGTPNAIYRLRLSQDDPNSLLTIHTMADLDGKAGAAQVVHALNVMCGLAENLGLTV